MLKDYFAAGGWGMYPTLLFGFFLFAYAVLYAIRREDKYGKLACVFAGVTFATGLLGSVTGFMTTVHYVLPAKLPDGVQFRVWIEGCEESLHNTGLALFLIVPSALVGCIGLWRAPSRAVAVSDG